MTKRQELIAKVAKRMARSTDYGKHPELYALEIKVIEITTDENEEYLMSANDRQWDCFSNAVLKLAEELHWDRYSILFDTEAQEWARRYEEEYPEFLK